MLRYTILRILVFFGCLSALWLVGLRDEAQRPWLVVGAFLLSMVVSFFVLRPFRDDAVRRIEERQRARLEARHQEPKTTVESDESVEDEHFR